MEKTKEQKIESIERFNKQRDKAIKKLSDAKDLYEYIDAVRYAYGFTMRYKSINLWDIIQGSTDINLLFHEPAGFLKKCLDSGILKPWNGTYWFDKEKAESLQQYILENGN